MSKDEIASSYGNYMISFKKFVKLFFTKYEKSTFLHHMVLLFLFFILYILIGFQ